MIRMMLEMHKKQAPRYNNSKIIMLHVYTCKWRLVS